MKRIRLSPRAVGAAIGYVFTIAILAISGWLALHYPAVFYGLFTAGVLLFAALLRWMQR